MTDPLIEAGDLAVPTKLPLLNLNCRMEPMPEDIAAGRGWPERRDYFIDLVKAAGAWVLTAQECTDDIRNDLLAALGGGDSWGYWRNGNVSVWGAKSRLQKVASDNTIMLPSPPDTDPRRLVVVQFRVWTTDNPAWRTTGRSIWVASSHFTVGDPYWQNQQMAAVVDVLAGRFNLRNSILGADINNSNTTGVCPRTIAADAGFAELYDKAGRAIITNDLANSYQGWQETVDGDQRIDGVFTGGNLQPYYGKIIETNLREDSPPASDHNWLRASAVQLNNE